MITRFSRYPGGKILGFGTTTRMQKRNYSPYDVVTKSQLAALIGIGGGLAALAAYLSYKSFMYSRNHYTIVKRNNMNNKNANSNEKNISEEHQSIRRPG